MDILEEDTLFRVSRQLEWKSRYPIPSNPLDMRNIFPYSDGKLHFVDYYRPDDIDRLDAIVQKVRSRVIDCVNEPR